MNIPPCILIVEDDAVCAEDLQDMLVEFGYSADLVSTGPAAIAHAETSAPDLVLMDIHLRGSMDGTEAAVALRRRFNIPAVYLTGHSDAETLARAKLAEPLGYLTKPCARGSLRAAIEIALHKHREELKRAEREALASAIPVGPQFTLISADAIHCGNFQIIAASPAMKKLVAFGRRVAESDARTILLEGESGTGKDVMARFMHHFGRRGHLPFIALNCAAIPDTLLESELFGYEPGAFTDARSAKPGIFEIASGGTLFLDEIGELPVMLQAKLLRVLEEQTFRRLGGVRDIQVDLCVVAASNRNLAKAVEEGLFRTDLYYRLNVVELVLSPLRERKADILPLAKHFIQHYNHKLKRNILGVTTGAAATMMDYDWPGNVRELRNSIERGVLLEELAWLQPINLRLGHDASRSPHPETGRAASGPLTRGLLEAGERQMLMEALESTGWNQSRAAGLLGISRDTLRCKIKRYNLPRPIRVAENRA